MTGRPDAIVRLEGRLICASQGERAAVLEHLGLHERLSRAEPGCLSFEVMPTDDPMVWRVSESFADAAAFAAHQARGAASDWGRATAGIARDYRITGLG